MRIKRIYFCKGQNLTEVALILGIVGLVLISMEVYFKRGLQGKVKDLTDNMIGKEQLPYEVDTLGLVVNNSSSKLSSGSTATLKELEGGKRSLSGSEKTTTEYTSTTEGK